MQYTLTTKRTLTTFHNLHIRCLKLLRKNLLPKGSVNALLVLRVDESVWPSRCLVNIIDDTTDEFVSF